MDRDLRWGIVGGWRGGSGMNVQDTYSVSRSVVTKEVSTVKEHKR